MTTTSSTPDGAAVEELLTLLENMEANAKQTVEYWEKEIQRLIDLDKEMDCLEILNQRRRKLQREKGRLALATQRVNTLRSLIEGEVS